MAEDSNKNKKHFFKGMSTELKKVTWLTPKQLANNTTAVVVMVLIVTAIVFVLDFTFEKINHYGVEGLKAVVQNDDANVDNDSVEGNEGTENDATNTVTNTVVDGAGDTNTVSNEVQE